MRRKSERTANKKVKSPEKKLEKVKRTRTRRRKHSTTSEESGDESNPIVEKAPPVDTEQKPPKTPVKEDSPEETQEQVWQVKTSESAEMGEIQKLKICLTRPPSTPERSPRSKRKHSRATSSSDTPSVDGSEEKKKKHRSKRAARESKEEETETPNDTVSNIEDQAEQSPDRAAKDVEVTQSSDTSVAPISTTVEAVVEGNQEQTSTETQKDEPNETKSSDADADTTVTSPKQKNTDQDDSQVDEKEVSEAEITINASNSMVEEVLKEQEETTRSKTPTPPAEPKDISLDDEVSKFGRNVSDDVTKEPESTETEEKSKATNKTNDVVESSTSVETGTPAKYNATKESNRNRKMSNDSTKDEEAGQRGKSIERSDSTSSNTHKTVEHIDSTHEEVQNGQAPPIVINRKRRWGSRPNKITTQKSITISTDVLKEIIPDVKPTEFEEVIEDKKPHKRVEIPERLERPILPKIIIDNSENVEQHRREHEEKEKEMLKEKSMTVNRKISIVKENDSIIARPPSPPRHKQSCILYITNLVRPFTLMQLKNLLLRTGRIVEDGFWIDKIKSKCFVQYETEDQAVETRHALHGVTWPVSNPKTLQVDFSSAEAFDKAKNNEDTEATQTSTIPGTVEDWLKEQDIKRERGEQENQKPWERKAAMREWDVGKNEKDKEKDKLRRDDRIPDKRRNRSIERSPEPARKFKKKEEEAPSKLLDDLFRKTKTTPCIYWLPLSAETIAIKEEQRRAHMAEHERRMQELRNRRRH